MQYATFGFVLAAAVFVWLARSLMLSAAAAKAVLNATPANERESDVYRACVLCMQAMTGAGALLLALALLQAVGALAFVLLQLVQFTRG